MERKSTPLRIFNTNHMEQIKNIIRRKRNVWATSKSNIRRHQEGKMETHRLNNTQKREHSHTQTLISEAVGKKEGDRPKEILNKNNPETAERSWNGVCEKRLW